MSTASPMTLTQSEATAARRRMLFHLTLTADGADATGLTLSGADVQISKNGAALGNATGTATELSAGWYQYEFAAADLDTVGALAVEINETGVDPLHVVHQVLVTNLNTLAASVASIQADTDDLQLSQPLRITNHVLGLMNANESTAGLSLAHAVDATVTLSGTFDGATVTLQFTADTTASPIVWQTYTASGNPATAAGTIAITGPLQGIRCTMSSAGASSAVTATVQIRTNQA